MIFMGLLPRQDSNLEPADPESDAIPLGPEAVVLCIAGT